MRIERQGRFSRLRNEPHRHFFPTPFFSPSSSQKEKNVYSYSPDNPPLKGATILGRSHIGVREGLAPIPPPYAYIGGGEAGMECRFAAFSSFIDPFLLLFPPPLHLVGEGRTDGWMDGTWKGGPWFYSTFSITAAAGPFGAERARKVASLVRVRRTADFWLP